MCGQKVTRHCSKCEQDINIEVSSKFINMINSEVYYDRMTCNKCGSDLSDKEKIKKNKENCTFILF